MLKYASFVLLAFVCVAANASGEPQSGFNDIKVGDIIDIPPSEFDIEFSKGYRKCLDDECEDFIDIPDRVPPPRKARVEQILQDHFIDLSAKHTVIYGVIEDKGESAHKFMRFQNGPVYDYVDITYESVATCQHPKTGLAYIVDIMHSGGNVDGDFGYVNFIGVNPQTREMEVVYEEYAEHGPYDSKICGWVAKQERLSMFSDAMKALRIEDEAYKTKIVKADDDELEEYEIVYASIGDLGSGETMQLPWRSIPAKVVQALLEKLDGLATDMVINGKTHPAMVEIVDAHIDDWRIIQVTGTESCSEYAEGVALARHASWKDWRAIYNVESGCSKSLNYPLLFRQEDGSVSITIENNMLQATMYYEFIHWGEFRDVAIDLRTNVITAK